MSAMTIPMLVQERLDSKVLSSSNSLEDKDYDTDTDMDLGEFQTLFEHKNFQSVLEVLGEHESYMASFMRAHSSLLRGDVPLSIPVRSEFLSAGGCADWAETGLSAANTKLQKLGTINQVLAHQPWTITPAHIEKITRSGSKDNWSLSELVYAIVLMAHFHAFSSFIESCVSVENGSKKADNLPSPISPTSNGNQSSRPFDCTSPSRGTLERSLSKEKRRRKNSSASLSSIDSCTAAEEAGAGGKHAPYDCSAPIKVEGANSSSGSPVTDLVDTLVQKMEELRAEPEADRKFLLTADFHYVDFAQRDRKLEFPTFRIQDFNWEEEGFSVISRFYDEIAQLLDDKFRTAYNMTYRTMGRLTAIDTTMFRRATWNYIQCLYGIRWDDYDYSRVNVLLHRSLKKYIKTAACYPNRCTSHDYKSIMQDFLPSEKVHVCLLVAEAKFQSELLYALRAIATHFRI